MVRQPITVDGAVMPRSAARALGADTAAILAELGYDTREIEALEADGTVHRAPKSPSAGARGRYDSSSATRGSSCAMRCGMSRSTVSHTRTRLMLKYP